MVPADFGASLHGTFHNGLALLDTRLGNVCMHMTTWMPPLLAKQQICGL
jgi:hypothetical protein